ncbi:isopentenyl-diphosphate Delta-isomerase [Nocardioides sp. zg-ZUI104]|uniref:isopentenyl-diphosphate Delta-isomerase n=1 Tax=Nocardioides faecalis TaxID=2803858 RepID=UPI001BD0E894|nr:isopentenyl-diphosphate Delta-isomerase [Nocardioides faecalis]MBS4753985.1 isopentenyl-diphosphate Delta-isomerase [Nocardioides faecalis]
MEETNAAPVEQVVLLDDEGRAIGTADKAAVHHRDTPLHLAFSCYVFDRAGRLLLTRRAHDKRTWPGVWTNSCCGHPAPGESPLEAVVRRTRQELGIELEHLSVVLPDFRYRAVMEDGTVEHEVCPVHVAVLADPATLAPDPAEVAEHAWVDWPSFRADVLAGSRDVSPWCRLQVEALPADPRPDAVVPAAAPR